MSHYYKHQKGLYRSRRGVLLGICRGMSDFLSLPVFWIRVTLVILFLVSGFFPIVLLYILAGLIMKKEPLEPEYNEYRSRFHRCHDRYGHYSENLRERLDRLKNKIQDTESNMSYREYRWNRKFNE